MPCRPLLSAAAARRAQTDPSFPTARPPVCVQLAALTDGWLLSCMVNCLAVAASPVDLRALHVADRGGSLLPDQRNENVLLALQSLRAVAQQAPTEGFLASVNALSPDALQGLVEPETPHVDKAIDLLWSITLTLVRSALCGDAGGSGIGCPSGGLCCVFCVRGKASVANACHSHGP